MRHVGERRTECERGNKNGRGLESLIIVGEGGKYLCLFKHTCPKGKFSAH